MTRDDADTLYKLLRSVCVIRKGQTLHVGGHVVGPTDRDHVEVVEPSPSR